MKNLLILPVWFFTVISTLAVSLWLYSYTGMTSSRSEQVLGSSTEEVLQPHLAYAAIPEAIAEFSTDIKTKDARPVVIDNYLAKYSSPMTGLGELIVSKAEELADKYQLDPTYLAFLTVAIGQNESNLGKKMPPDCFNAWGYGIHSAGTLCFQNWEEGITRFMTGVAENYITKRGLDTPEEMMTMYTPHSPNGAWAKGVNQFLADLYEAKN